MSRALIDFALQHLHEDTAKLLLSASRYPDIDMPAAVQQIEGLRTAAVKWPSLLDCPGFVYPPRLNREQSSSEATARHKVTVAGEVASVADLTGGMGIDSMAFAQAGAAVTYLERDPMLCELMQENCRELGLEVVAVHCVDSMEWLSENGGHYDLIVVDPARRDIHGRKVVAFEACSPDVVAGMDTLMEYCVRLMVKASPMIDIDMGIRQLRFVEQVHVVAVDGECKEVLFLCGETAGEVAIHCCDILGGDTVEHSFTRESEAAAEVSYCDTVGRYIYEPSAALLKGGAFRSVCGWYGVDKLDRNTHLYTSDKMVDGFQGRVFEVIGETSLNTKAVRRLLPEGKASVICRGWHESAETLQRRLRLANGGDLMLVATTIHGHPTGFVCRRK